MAFSKHDELKLKCTVCGVNEADTKKDMITNGDDICLCLDCAKKSDNSMVIEHLKNEKLIQG